MPTNVFEADEEKELIRDASGKAITLADTPAPRAFEAPAAPTLEERITPASFGTFVPESLEELQGDFFDSVQAGWSDGILGYATRPDEVSPQQRDAIAARASDYAQKHGFRNFIGGAIGGIASDLPAELPLLFAGGPLLSAAGKAARAAGAAKAANRIDNARRIATGAFKANTRGAKGVMERMAYEGFVGSVAAIASVEAQTAMGREFSADEIMNRVASDAVGSILLTEAFRLGGKAFGKMTKAQAEDKVMSDVKETIDGPAGLLPQRAEFSKRLDLDETIAAERAFHKKLSERQGAPSAEVTNALSDHSAKTQRKIDRIRDGEIPDFAKSIPEGEVLLRTEADIDDVFRNLLDSNPKDMDGQIGIIKNLMKSRAIATGHRSLDDWLAKAKLMVGQGEDAKTIFGQTHTILSVPYKATSFRELVHEMGHVFEFDLDSRTLRTIADEYGASTKDIFSRDVSERFAQDFELYVSDLAGGRDSELSGALRQAFDKMLKYLKDIFTGLPTDPIDPKMREVFDNIFGAERTSSPIGDVDAFRKARVAVKAQRGGEELFFTPREGDDFGAFQEAKAEELISDLDNGADEIESSALADKKGLANRTWNAFRRKAPAIFGAGVLTPQSLFSGLGDTGKKIWESLQLGIQREAEFQSRNTAQINGAMEATDFGKADSTALAKKSEVSLGDGAKRNMSGQEALLLSMYARNKGGKYSAHQSLVQKGYQPEGSEDVVKLTQQQVNEMATDTWLLENAGESGVKAAEMLRLAFTEMAGNERNMMSNRGVPEDKIALSEDYFPKKGLALTRNELKKLPKSARDAIASENIQKVLASSKGRKHKQVQSDMFASRSANIKRQGNTTLVFQNPLEALMKHSDQQTRFEALADEVSYAKAWSNGMSGDIDRFVGSDINKAIETSLETVAGGRGGDPIAGKIAGQLFKGQVLSALSFNLSPIAKQMPSLVTGLQHLGFTPKEGPRFLKAASDKKLHEEMMELFPTYQMRYLSAGQNADLHDIGLADSFNSRMLGGTDLTDAAAQGPLKGLEAVAQKGMAGIRGADAAVIRSLYLGAKEKLDLGDVDFKDLEPAQRKQIEDRMSKIINETQPSYHPLTRSTSQSSSNILTRQFSMFASQPMKNFNLMMRDLQALSLDPENVELKNRVKRTAQIIALQTALVTGSGTTALLAKDKVLDAFRSDEAKEDREKYYEDMGQASQRFWQQAFSSTFGNFPVGGQFLGTLLQKVITGEGFDVEAMPIGLYNDLLRIGGDINNTLTNDDVTATEISETIGRAFKLAMAPTGFPSVFNQTAKAIAQ